MRWLSVRNFYCLIVSVIHTQGGRMNFSFHDKKLLVLAATMLFNNSLAVDYYPTVDDKYQLGVGVDYASGKTYGQGIFDVNQVASLDSGQIIKTKSEYKDFTSYYSGIAQSNDVSNFSVSSGFAAGYGMFKASGAFAASFQKQSAKNDLSTVKSVGLMYTTEYTLPVAQVDSPSAEMIADTAYALLKMNPGITAELLEIASAIGLHKKALISKFYQNHGTHFISSIKKAVIGTFNSKLIYKQDTTSKASAMAGKISADIGAFSSVQASISTSSSSFFNSENYSVETETSINPYIDSTKNVLTTLESLKSSVMQTIALEKGLYDFSKVKITPSELPLPGLPRVELDSDGYKKAKQEAEAKSKKLSEIIIEIQQILHDTDMLQERFNYVGELKQQDKLPEAKQALEAFIKLYKEKNITSRIIQVKNNPNYAMVGRSYVVPILNAESVAKNFDKWLQKSGDTILDSVSDIAREHALLREESQDRSKQEQAINDKVTNKTYIQWLKDIKYPEVKKGDSAIGSFNQWYKTLQPALLIIYRFGWIDFLAKKKILDAQDLVILKQQISADNMFRRLKITGSSNSNFKPTNRTLSFGANITEYPNIDFSLSPYTQVFPELSYEPLDDTSTLLLMKYIEMVDEFLSMYDYIDYISYRVTPSKSLTDIVQRDQSILSALKKLKDDLMNGGSGDNTLNITFNGSTYNILTASGASGLSSAFISFIRQSYFIQTYFVYFSALNKLVENEYISPRGVLLGAHLDQAGKLNGSYLLNTLISKLNYPRKSQVIELLRAYPSIHKEEDNGYGSLLSEVVNSNNAEGEDYVLPTYLPILIPESVHAYGNVVYVDLTLLDYNDNYLDLYEKSNAYAKGVKALSKPSFDLLANYRFSLVGEMPTKLALQIVPSESFYCSVNVAKNLMEWCDLGWDSRFDPVLPREQNLYQVSAFVTPFKKQDMDTFRKEYDKKRRGGEKPMAKKDPLVNIFYGSSSSVIPAYLHEIYFNN